MKRNIYIMYIMALLQGMVFYGPVATLYRQAQGVSVFQITVIEGISLALCILCEVPWGIVADKIGYRRTIIFCSCLYFLSKIVFWRATDFYGFLVERLMLSIVVSGLSGVDTSILYLSCCGQDSQKVFGVYDSLGMLGLLIAAGTFSAFVQSNYALAGLLTVVSYGIAALLSFGITEVRPNEAEEQAEPFMKTLRNTLNDQTLTLFLIAMALLGEAHQTITVFLNQVKYESCGLGNSAIGVIYIIATMAGLLAAYSANVTKRLGVLRSLLFFCLLPIASCLVLAFIQYAVPSVISILTLRISNTLLQPFRSKIQNNLIRVDNRATALSIHSMLMNCIAIGTNLAFGALSEWNLSASFLFGCVICGFSLVMLIIWYNRTGMLILDHNIGR